MDNLLQLPKRNVKDRITHIRNSMLIQDPFPEQTLEKSRNRFFAMLSAKSSLWSKLLLKNAETVAKHGHKVKQVEEISIWKAYRMGYQQAYKEILENVGDCWEERK